MPTPRRNRPSRVIGLLWILSLFVAATFATTLGSGAARAENHEPPIQCPGADGGGPLPAGSQEITGSVSDGIDPVAGIQVRLTSTAGGMSTTQSTATGEFRFQLLGNGTYFVSFYDHTATYASGFYGGAGSVVLDKADATGVFLGGGGATGVDAVVGPETYGSISGMVTNNGGIGVDSVLVSVRGAHFPLVGCDETDGAGSYQISNLRSGVYTVVAESAAYPPASYGSTVTVPPDATNINLQFPPVHTLSGVVLTAGGDPVPSISVDACEITTNACKSGLSGVGTGSFDIPGLVAGAYVLRYQDSSGTYAYRTGYYGGDAIFVATAGEAISVAVPGDPVQLLAVPSPTVSGTITPLGTPEDTILVSLCDEFEENCFADYADGSGVYTVGVAVPGTYKARVFDYSDTYPSGGYIGPGGTIVIDPALALEIVVDVTDAGPIDATLPAGGRIAVAEISGGAPVQYGFVEFCRGEFACPDGAGMDEFGVGQSPVMFTGTYFVKAHSADFSAQYWYVEGAVASIDFADATPVEVTANSTASINVEIPLPGIHTDDGGPGVIAPVEVVLDDGTGSTPVSLTFSDVTVSGTTTLTTSETGDPVPDGFQLGLPATYFDISTTAEFVAPITLCFSYAGVSYVDEANLRLFHFDGGWIDITVPPVDTVNDVICGSANSLSPFVLAERSYVFTGFFQPVDNLALNRAQAGSGVPVKFSLGGDFGLAIFADGSPSVSQITCPGTIADTIEQTVSVGSSHLVYDVAADQYVYQFKTARSWAGSCRQLSMVFADGTTRTVDFQFTR